MKSKKMRIRIHGLAICVLLSAAAQGEVVKCTTVDGRTIYGDASACAGTKNASVVSTQNKISTVKRQNALPLNDSSVDIVNIDGDEPEINVTPEKPAKKEQFKKPHIEHLNPKVERLTPRKILERKKRRLSELNEVG